MPTKATRRGKHAHTHTACTVKFSCSETGATVLGAITTPAVYVDVSILTSMLDAATTWHQLPASWKPRNHCLAGRSKVKFKSKQQLWLPGMSGIVTLVEDHTPTAAVLCIAR